MNPIVPKVLGADFELANMLLSAGESHGRVGRAAELLLNEIPGFPVRRYGGSTIEYGRRFLAGNGGSAYIDSDHLEINVPEHLNSRHHALHIHAGLRIARQAQLAASERLPTRTRLEVLANNCDGHVSYGAHLNVMTSRRCFDDLLHHKPHLAGFLATHLVTSVIYTGQGMVGAANGKPACDFQLSQRADWFERMGSIDTMHNRPLVNHRDEPHAAQGLARLHIIFLDCALQPVANWLRAGTTQLVVALCEAGWADATLLLDNPVEAASAISRDLSLRETLPLAVRGQRRTALEIQQSLLDLAASLVATGAMQHAVPDAEDLLHAWQQTLDLLRQRAIEGLAARCDNWLKYLLLERQRVRRGISWQGPELKTLDLRYGSLDPDDGLFLQMAQAGCVEQMPTRGQIERHVVQPPDDTRAYLRASILRRWGDCVSHMDWSWMEFRVPCERGWWSVARLPMNDPCRFNREECEALLDESSSLSEVVAALDPDQSQLKPQEPNYSTAD